MSGLATRVRKLEATRGAAGVTDAEMAEAKRLARRQAQLIIRESFAGAGLPWPPTGQALPWPPTEAERAEIEEIKAQKAWVRDVLRRDWEAKNPGQSYAAHQEERRAEARRLIEAAFGQGEAREAERQRLNREWEARNARADAGGA